jgi:tetratricopeptide (TPR) repeat protein
MEEFWRGEMSHDQKPQTSLYFWAVALERHGDLDAAYAKLGEALEVDPAHEMSENRRGTIREKQRRLDEALAHYRTAAEILPDFRDAHLNAARVLTALGRPAEAQAARDLADRADPRMPRRFVSWARYLLKKGRKEAAAAELQRALQANPDDAEARELLARSGS